MGMSRRSFIAGAATILGALGIAGCSSKSDENSASATESWTAAQDDELAVLTMQVSGGNVVAMTGDGWAPRDGYVQLQLSGGSIPGQEIDAVTRAGNKLLVTLASSDGPATLNLMLTEYRLEGGDASAIEGVTADYGNGTVEDLQKSYD